MAAGDERSAVVFGNWLNKVEIGLVKSTMYVSYGVDCLEGREWGSLFLTVACGEGNIGTVVHRKQRTKGKLEIQGTDENCSGVESISGERRH